MAPRGTTDPRTNRDRNRDLMERCWGERIRGYPTTSGFHWWARWDSNPGPKDYESSALTD